MPANITEIRKRAEAGSCVAQSILGISYLHGIDVGVDYKEAFRFLSAAANQGASRPLLNLAHMYAKELGIPQDLPQAIRLLEAVARPGASSDAFAARIELGRIFSRSLGILADTDAAVQWYSAAVAVAPDEDCEEVREARAYIGANS